MSNVFDPSVNDPAVFTTDKFPLLKDGDGNTYKTVVKANVNGNIDVYSKGTGLFGADELLFQYSAARNAADFSDGIFKDKPITAFDSFFRANGSNGVQILTEAKTKWYQEAPSNAATRMATLDGYKSIAATTEPRTTPNIPDQAADVLGQATGVPQTDPNVPETVDFLNQTFDSNARSLSNFLKGPYYYPEAIRSNGQDYIQFTLIEYGTKTVNTQNPDNVTDLFKLSSRTKSENAVGSVFLPIQQGISDQSMVSWADENMSPLAIALMQSAANPESIGGNAESIAQKIIGNSDYQKMIQQQLYGAAAGVNPLARLSGLVVNPNLELLFNGPTLRPFNFTFRLSPRTSNEAKQVKNIIRWFKQGSVVRTTTDNLFLKAPNVFKIQYVYGEDKQNENNPTHPGLNKIKTCALRSMNVNYNPDGSYMTFQDGTMTSYEMTLQFSELEPVYDIDYDNTPDNNIGY